MNLPNKLTVMRIILSFIFIFYIFSQGIMAKTLALVIFTIASITDFLDGYIARKYNLITDLGKLLDPLADKILVLSAFAAFVYLSLIPIWMFIIIISREVLITFLRIVFISKGRRVIAASVWGKYKTVSQMIAIFVILGSIILKELGTNKYDFWSTQWDLIAMQAISVLMCITIIFTLISGIAYFAKNINASKN